MYAALNTLRKPAKTGVKDYIKYPYNPIVKNNSMLLDTLIQKARDKTLKDDYSRTIRTLVEYYSSLFSGYGLNGLASSIIAMCKDKDYVRTTPTSKMILEDVIKVLLTEDTVNFYKYNYIKTVDKEPNIHAMTVELDIKIDYKSSTVITTAPEEIKILLWKLGLEHTIQMLELLRFVQISNNNYYTSY